MIYKLLPENIQDIIDKKIISNTKKIFQIVLNELKYKQLYNNYYLLDNTSTIFINNYIVGWGVTGVEKYIFIKYGNVYKHFITSNKLLFNKKKLLVIQTIYKWNIKKFLSCKI